MSGVLTLPLKAEYFDAIRDGQKPKEYRLTTPFWRKRLENRTFAKIVLTRGCKPCHEPISAEAIERALRFASVCMPPPQAAGRPDPCEGTKPTDRCHRQLLDQLGSEHAFHALPAMYLSHVSTLLTLARAELDRRQRETMAAFGAADAACVHYPGENQAAERAAYMAGAADIMGGAPDVERVAKSIRDVDPDRHMPSRAMSPRDSEVFARAALGAMGFTVRA